MSIHCAAPIDIDGSTVCGEPIVHDDDEGWFHAQVGPHRGHTATPPDPAPPAPPVVRDTDEHISAVQALIEEARRAGEKAGAEAERARIVALLEAADPDAPGSDVPCMEYVRFREDEFFASTYNEAVTDALEWAAKKVALDPDAPTNTPEATS